VIIGPTDPELGSELVDAIHSDRLSVWAEGVGQDTSDTLDERARTAAVVRATCHRIRSANEDERDRVVRALHDADTAVIATSVSGQRHSVTVTVRPDDVIRTLDVLHALGYRSSRSWSRGAWESFRRFGDSQVLTRDGSVSVRVRWGSGRRGRLRRLVVPTAADWDLVDLPVWLWWAYSGVRPVRLAAERLGVRSRDHSMLEPFLVTPPALVEQLLDVASVGPDDVLFDHGCGDGRLVVSAASIRGCRSIGVEQSAELCALARKRAAASGVVDRVRIVHGDAATVDLAEVTVVVLFLPMVVAARVVPDLMTRLSPGARIVLHEQSRLGGGIPRPDSTVAVVADDAVTVAHRWVVGG
jgi:hypothetical protein